jgi:hypothetical protein
MKDDGRKKIKRPWRYEDESSWEKYMNFEKGYKALGKCDEKR